MSKLKPERVTMTGRGPRYTYKIVDEQNNIVFRTSANSYLSWTRKKDAQAIIDAIESKGMEYVAAKLDYKGVE